MISDTATAARGVHGQPGEFLPAPEVLKEGDIVDCQHFDVYSDADDQNIEVCLLCGRVRRCASQFYQDMVDANEKRSRT